MFYRHPVDNRGNGMGGYHYLSIHGKDIQLLIPQASSSTVRRNVVCFTQVPFCGGYTSVVMAKVVSGCWIPTLWSCFPFFATSGSAETGTKTYRRLSWYVWEEPCNSNLVYYQTRSVIDTKHVTGTFRLLEHISFCSHDPPTSFFVPYLLPWVNRPKVNQLPEWFWSHMWPSFILKLGLHKWVSVCPVGPDSEFVLQSVQTDKTLLLIYGFSMFSHCSVHHVLVSVNLN